MKYPWPQPGQCWRGRIHSADYDRWRLLENGEVVQVYKGGTLGMCKSLASVLKAEEEGSWIRCQDKNQPEKYYEPWHYKEHDQYIIDDAHRRIDNLDTVQMQRVVSCVNALAGIRNPQAVKELILEMKYAIGPSSAWYKIIQRLDEDPKNEN